MKRIMTIKIVNTDIDEKWIKHKDHLEHGKWVEGSPPADIARKSIAFVKSEKQTGAAYGTTGWISFKSSTTPGSSMTITWNKPYGSNATTCTVDMNSTSYTAKVKNKVFQESEAFCDVVISKNTQSVIDTKTWMSKLPEGTTLNNVIMPGSHDAGMSELHHCSIGVSDANTQTQQLDIKGQLEAGSRYFDLRIDYDHDELVTYHRTDVITGWGCSGQLLETVLTQAKDFLRENKTETAILKFSHIRKNSKETKTKIYNMLMSPDFKDCLYKSKNENLANIAINKAAGKMIIVLDYPENNNVEEGLFRFHDGFVDNVCSYRDLNITICDSYSNTSSYSKMAADQISKWDQYAGFGKDYLFLLSWTLTTVSGSIRDLAKEANDHLPDVLANQITVLKKGKPNIVYIDFVNIETNRKIISYNTLEDLSQEKD